MSKQSTVLLTAGPRTIAPWGDRVWRVSLTAQLVAANSGDYWIVSPTQPAEFPVANEVINVEVPSSEAVVESVLMLLSAHLGDSAVEGYLLDTGNVETVDGKRVVAPFWDVSAPETMRYLARKLSETVRLGFTFLDGESLVDHSTIATLRSFGFDVDVFALESPTLR